MAKMYRVPPAGPAWHAVGARLERGVRHCCVDYRQSCWECHGQSANYDVREADRVITQYVDAYLAEHGLTVESIAAPMFAEYEPNPGPPDSVLH